ncbi:MAG TPA: NfeD family protein [Sphingomicrobium sp.]|nr:NfeD family protein [Sphingomicrobium sp.]
MTGLPLDPAWVWLIGGVLLLTAELIAPGFFLMFVGVAAILTGLLSLALPIGSALQLGAFAILAIVIARVGGRRAYASRYDHSSDPSLNNPVHRLLGRVVLVVEPVDSNGGRVRVGDSVWPARGGPARVGERVRVVDVEGNCLKVEPEHVLPSS